MCALLAGEKSERPTSQAPIIYSTSLSYSSICCKQQQYKAAHMCQSEVQLSCSSTSSSLEELRGKQYPVCLRRRSDGTVSAIFSQFSFGTGTGETEEEATEDAGYILAWGLHYYIEAGEDIPEPASLQAAEAIMKDWDVDDSNVVSVSWAQVEVKPEFIEEDP